MTTDSEPSVTQWIGDLRAGGTTARPPVSFA